VGVIDGSTRSGHTAGGHGQRFAAGLVHGVDHANDIVPAHEAATIPGSHTTTATITVIGSDP